MSRYWRKWKYWRGNRLAATQRRQVGRGWNARSEAILATLSSASPASQLAAAGGNMGWQASQLQSGSLRRGNVFLRASWTHEEWQPAIDLLLTPNDGGYVMTASLGWQGDRVRVDGGIRTFGGPKDSLYAQTPVKSIAYLGLTGQF